jgi:tetratricopeptide (TPR) repeat protein/transcriptional regulator with XRE-family HTH domain
VFGRSVAGHRRRLGLTQEDLAAQTGLSVRSIRDVETGRVARPRVSTVRLLADAFGLADREREQFVQAPGSPALGHGPETPRQLPLDVRGFAGRLAHLERLDACLESDPAHPTTVVVSAVAGMAGVGKTALALHWAHRRADRFPDGQLYVDLRGFGAAEAVVDPADALRGFLEALQVPVARIPADPDARAALFRSLLADRRMLLVLDNARDDVQVRPLLPGAGRCVVVVTSRDRLSGLIVGEGARPLHLDVLADDEAAALLAGRLGADRLAQEPVAVDAIIAATGRLPLALSIVAARVATHPTFPLASFAAQLSRVEGRLDALGDGDVRRVFSWSYLALSKEAARLFRLLGLHPGPDLTVTAAAALLGAPIGVAEVLLADLTRLHLVIERVPGRYTLHDLLRAYAAELTRATDNDDEQHDAQARLYAHYLETAFAAAVLVQPQWQAVPPLPAVTGTPPAEILDHDRALEFFTAEHPVLLRCVHQAAETGFEAYAWRLAWTLATFYAPTGRWRENVGAQQVALEAAVRAADLTGQATANRLRSRADIRLGHVDEAETHLRQALDLYERLDDPTGQAQTLHNLAELCEIRGRPEEAVHNARTALRLYRQAGNRDGEARSLNGIGWLAATAGDYQEAITCCTAALAVQQTSGDRNGQGATLDSLAFTYTRMGEPDRAADACEQAVTLFRESADRYHEAETLMQLGDIRETLAEFEAADDAWQRAAEIFDDLNDATADEARRRLAAARRTG